MVEQRQAQTGAGRGAMRIGIGANGGVAGVDGAVVGEAIELRLRDLRDGKQRVVAQFADRFPAAIAQQFGRVIGAAEEASAIAALLGSQQRGGGILAVEAGERREAVRQRLRAAERCFDLGEVDTAGGTRSERIAVVGAAEPFDALAEGNVELVDALQAVGVVAVGLDLGSRAADRC